MHFVYNGYMPWNIWFKYMAVVAVEVLVWFISLKKLDKWDIETNYGRDK